MSIEDFIIEVFYRTEKLLTQLTSHSKIRSSGPPPALFDSEAITMEIVGEFIGFSCDADIWSYFKQHWAPWFPKLGTRATFVRQIANLWWVKEQLQALLAKELEADLDTVHYFDGLPLPLCHLQRACCSTTCKGTAAFGYCAAKAEHYYGLKGHLIISSLGIPTAYTLSPANTDERDVLPEISEGLRGLLIADKGLIRPALKEELALQGLYLETPLRKNMTDTRPKWLVKKFSSMRRLVETVIGQLVGRFQIETIRARTLFHYSRRFCRKMLAHTMAFAINALVNPTCPLRFELLLVK